IRRACVACFATDEARLLPRLLGRAPPVSGSGAQHLARVSSNRRIGTRARVVGRAGCIADPAIWPEAAAAGEALSSAKQATPASRMPPPESRSAGGTDRTDGLRNALNAGYTPAAGT